MTASLAKLVAMWDSPNEAEATVAFQAARRAVLRDGSKFRDLVVPQSAAPLAVTHRPPVDVIAAGRFDTARFLTKMDELLSGLDNVRLIRCPDECYKHRGEPCIEYTDRTPDSPWECLVLPKERRIQNRDPHVRQIENALLMSLRDSVGRILLFCDRYEPTGDDSAMPWYLGRRLARRGIKIFCVLFSSPHGNPTALKKLASYCGGTCSMACTIEYLEEHTMPALMKFIGAT